jgi:hypothetical protein
MAEPDPPVEPAASPVPPVEPPAPPEPPARPDPVATEAIVDEPSPPTYSKAPFWIGILLLLVVAGAGAGVVAALAQPDICDGTTFRSDRFGYCLVVPDGWEADGEGTLGEIPADRIQMPGDIATVYVQAVSIGEGQNLQDFADSIRSLDEQAGYRLEAITETTVAGVPALRWDFVTGVKGGVQLKMRELVFVDGSNGWRMQMAEGKPSFDETAATVDAMLDTWVFA